jgi:hypothetical protein
MWSLRDLYQPSEPVLTLAVHHIWLAFPPGRGSSSLPRPNRLHTETRPGSPALRVLDLLVSARNLSLEQERADTNLP